MMRKWVNYLYMILTLFLLAGCNSVNKAEETLPVITPNIPSGDIATILPTNQQKQTLRNPTIEPTKRVISGEQAIQKSEELLLSSCLPIHSGFSTNLAVLQDLFITKKNTPYVYDLNANTYVELQPPTLIAGEDYFISPDGKWVAYQVYQAQEGRKYLTVVPVSSFRKNLREPHYQWSYSDQFYVQRWFNEDTLLITRSSNRGAYPTAKISTVILNPFTQEEHEFNLEDYPNYKQYKAGGVGSYLFGHSNLLPDPTLSRLVYPEVTGHMYYTTLWNLEREEAVVRLDFFIEDISNDPLWSQDGKDFLIQDVGLDPKEGGEWFQITREGDVTQLTHFSRFLSPPGQYLTPSRSPDGQYLVFWMDYRSGDASGNEHSKYYVLDLKSPTLEGFCIDAKPFSGGELQEPVWSQDNDYVAISNVSNGLGDLILIDINKRQAYKIGKDVIARGWIAHP